MTTKLIVTFRREGFHSWPEAPPSRSYLADRHRHMFHFRCELWFPRHEDRDVEFHDLLARCRAYIGEREFLTSSCEAIALFICRRMVEEYSLAGAVEVWEDGECGARVEMTLEECK